jgi:phosphate starvation-inducible protein PhoH and related proteins
MNLLIPKTPGQIRYVEVLKKHAKPVVIAMGPAGSGKTLFACQEAVERLSRKHVDRIVLTRPLISADEELGYLPGSMEQKMDPWTRPMFDILHRYYSSSKVKQMVKNQIIEISPLAYMRGRTFDDCFVIADEMQNSTANQMKMLLTRVGEGTKLVVTGDIDQCDLKYGLGGLSDLVPRLEGKELEYLEHVVLEKQDVQRHPVVKEILDIYQ